MTTAEKKPKATKPVKSLTETVKKIAKKVEVKISSKTAAAPRAAKKTATAKAVPKQKATDAGAELPMVLERDVVFTYLATDGAEHHVFLAGDFNGWSTQTHPLRPVGNKYQITLSLPPGSYRYKFVVDDCWLHDAGAEAQEWNELGTLNSIVWV